MATINSTREHKHFEFTIEGAHCGGCLNKIESSLRALPSVAKAQMNLSTKRLFIELMPSSQNQADLIRHIKTLGFDAELAADKSGDDTLNHENRRLLLAMAVAGFAAMNVMLMSIAVWTGGDDMQSSTRTILHWLSALIALPTVAYSGHIFFGSALKALKKKRANMDVPISLALILACALSLYETVHHNPNTYFDAAVMLLFFLLIGRYLDARLRRHMGLAAAKLLSMRSADVTRITTQGKLETIPAARVRAGDILSIARGQHIPVDGIIINGDSEVDNQVITGESQPVFVRSGDALYSGAMNLLAPLTLRATAREQDSFLADISKLVSTAEQWKSRYIRIADKAARLYVPTVHMLAFLTFAGWWVINGELRPAIINAIAVLIITCPCALGLAVPAVQISAASKLFKRGVLLKSGDALERLSETKYIVFDKTGTLTTGEFTLTNEAEIDTGHLKKAAALARHSAHPIAKALQAIESDIRFTALKEIPGHGISGRYNGVVYYFGKHKDKAQDPSGDTASYLYQDDLLLAGFHFADKPRDDAKEAIKSLTDLGYAAEIISGDTKNSVQATAEALNISHYAGDQSPQDKQARLMRLKEQSLYPLMIGDGINDAPSLAGAHISMSLASGSDISRAASDIILQRNRLADIPFAIKIAQQSRQRIFENLSFAVIYNMFAVPIAVIGYVNPLIAALAMSGSSVCVTLNSLRVKTK